jgi:hypothetical protein
MPAGTFFDIAVVHLLTIATINHLRALYPQGRFEVRPFRPNIVVSTGSEDAGLRRTTGSAGRWRSAAMSGWPSPNPAPGV